MNSGEEPPDAVVTDDAEPPQIVEGQETGVTTAGDLSSFNYFCECTV